MSNRLIDRLRALVLLAGAVSITFLSTACSGPTSIGNPDKPKDPADVSDLPWARPESWEGTAGYGNLPQSQ